MTEETKVCADCGLEKPLSAFSIDKKRKEGRGSYCKSCMSKRVMRSCRKNADSGLCYCGKSRYKNYKLCKSCREFASASIKRRRAAYIKLGFCVRCGKLPPVKGKKLCEACQRNNNIAIRKTQEKYVKGGLCPCGKPRDGDFKTCSLCRERNRGNRKNNADKGLCSCGREKAKNRKRCEFCLASNSRYGLKIAKTILGRLKSNLRTRLRNAIVKSEGGKECSAVRDLGCSIDEFMVYFESMFYDNPRTGEKMSWDNYGKRDPNSEGWHIDHIKPLVSFDLINIEEQIKAVHYTNLRPKWAIDNIKDGCKLRRKNRSIY